MRCNVCCCCGVKPDAASSSRPDHWGAIELGVGVVRDLLVDEGDDVVGEEVRVGGGGAVGGGGRGGQFGFVLGSCEGLWNSFLDPSVLAS
jgi:hypothetical protein